ncbi:MAG: PEGA domain-containing protein [Eubacterium sp.]|nr:PEGA domain-containing protein [Eubacterium sp.]
MKKFLKYVVCVMLMAATIAMLAGCGTSGGSNSMVKGSRVGGTTTQETDTSEDEVEVEEDVYRIDEIDTVEQMIRFENLSNGQLERYTYNGSTYVYDKNEISTTVESLYCGMPVTFEVNKESELLKSVTESNALWIQNDISEFTLNEEEGILTIGPTDYVLSDITRAYQDNERIVYGDISQEDVLSVIGTAKKIISLVVTSGHGTIRLTNTDLFEGGWLTVGTVVSKEIEKDMEFDVSAGTYTVAVANNGYGDNTDVEVKANEVTLVDCNKLKGEGPKYCKIKFTVPYDGAKLYINGKETDYSKEVTLQYGAYSLQVEAEGYATWSRTLVVASETATIGVVLSAESETESETSSDDSSTSTESASSGTAGSLAGSLAGSEAGSTSGSSSSSSSSSTTGTSSSTSGSTSSSSSTSTVSDDTLSTLSDLISNLAGSSDDDDD